MRWGDEHFRPKNECIHTYISIEKKFCIIIATVVHKLYILLTATTVNVTLLMTRFTKYTFININQIGTCFVFEIFFHISMHVGEGHVHDGGIDALKLDVWWWRDVPKLDVSNANLNMQYYDPFA